MRVITFGSVPPEWGGPRRGGVASFHATLIETLCGKLDAAEPVEIVGVVTTGSGAGPAPVPVRIAVDGKRRQEFLQSVLDELKPDVALLNHFSTSWGRSLPKIAPELPLIGIAHSWHPVTYAADYAAAHERMQRAMDGLTTLVVPSRHCLEEGPSLGLRYPERTHVVRYPLGRPFAQPVDLDQPRTGVVFAGELVARKNPAAVLDALRRLPDLTATFAGDGSELPALEKLAAAGGVTSRARFAGSLGPEALAAVMARAEVTCLPSLSESFGIVYIESLACGTPVVGFRPTLREISRTIGVDPGIGLPQPTGEAVAAAIAHVRGEHWDRSALRHAVLDAYSAEAVAHEYATILASAARSA